ncbi:MAG: NAD(P)/FAD-dependent oxidoreductase [Chloroflexota bacterium]|nr:NAD(P)/FAD-dependent oxidoreductase [Chloroflexota bacterium]
MNIAIIGAGYAGLTAAHDLGKEGHRVTLYEALPEAGGLAAGFKAPHWEWPLEKFYHHLFTNDDAIISLAEELGIGDRLTTYRPSTVVVHEDKLYPFDGALPLLLYPGLSLPEKLRMGLTLAYLKVERRWHPFERVTAHEWLPRWMGRGGYEKVWEPMLLGKFGDFYRDVPMAWFWARIFKRTPRLIYPDGGFQTITDALVRAAKQHGAVLHLGTPVDAIRQDEEGWTVSSTEGSASFDRVIATVSPELLVRLVPALPDAYLRSLRDLDSLGAVVMTVALLQRLSEDSYWVNLDKRVYPMLALVEHTNMVDPKHYGGDHLIYLGDYLPPTHPYFSYDADQLFEVYEPVLRAFNPAYKRSWVRDKWLWKAHYAQPIVPLNYSGKIPPMRTPLAGLYFASMSQVYPWDRGTNYAVEIGHKVAREVLTDKIARTERATAPT